jgi:hypothetical protein
MVIIRWCSRKGNAVHFLLNKYFSLYHFEINYMMRNVTETIYLCKERILHANNAFLVKLNIPTVDNIMNVLICNLCFLLLINALIANMEGRKYNYDHLVHKYYHKINIFINNYVCNMFYIYVGRLLVIDVIVRPAVSVSVFLAIMCIPFGCLAPEDYYMILRSNIILVLRVSDEGYSRNTSSALI